MEQLSVPSYERLLPKDNIIKSIQGLCDYVNRWKTEVDKVTEETIVDSDALFSNSISTEQKKQTALMQVLMLEQMYGYTSTTSTNPEYEAVILDSEDRILAGKKVNGKIELFGVEYD